MKEWNPWKTLFWLIVFVVSLGVNSQAASTFQPGDLMVSLSNGTVQWRASDGTLIKVLATAETGQAKGMAFDRNTNLYVTHWYATDLKSGNDVEVFNPSGTYTGKFGSSYDCNPTSIVFDAQGNAYVGQSDCNVNVLKFNSAGTLLSSFPVSPENRGSGWVDLAKDGCTLYYTSAGTHVKRYNVCTSTQLPDFNAIPIATTNGLNGLRILADGSVLVAGLELIYHLDSSGNPAGTYDAVGGQCWYSVSPGPDSNTFWAGDFCNGTVYQFNFSTGAVLKLFSTGAGTHVKDVVVVPPQPNPQPNPHGPPPSPELCRMTGGGSVFTSGGIRVTHGFQLRAPATVQPQSLEVNWNDPKAKGPDEFHFHLTDLTSATCVDDPSINPEHPVTDFDTFIARGTGTLNGTAGATIELVFTDAGEPGTEDTATMTIRDSSGTVALVVSGPLDKGNQQMH